jgi:hypothetical protein
MYRKFDVTENLFFRIVFFLRNLTQPTLHVTHLKGMFDCLGVSSLDGPRGAGHNRIDPVGATPACLILFSSRDRLHRDFICLPTHVYEVTL